MTEKDLHTVWRLLQQVTKQEKYIANLRLSAEDLVPLPSDVPPPLSTVAKSRVEKLALKLVEAEQKLVKLREQLILARLRLTELILGEIDRADVQRVVYLRYVDCLSYAKIAKQMGFSVRHVFRLHAKIKRVMQRS